MRQFVPADYVDKKGNVYETVGENIREGKNGAVTSEFPTPEEIGVGGLVGSDGKNYTVALKNLANTSLIKGTYNLLRYNSMTKIVDYVSPNNDIKNAGYGSLPPTSQAVLNYTELKTIIPTGFKKYNVAFGVNNGNITIDNIDNIPGFEVKLIGDYFVVKSSLNISFIEITSFDPLAPEVVILDTQIYFDETKLAARINTNKDGNYQLLLIAG